MSFVVVLGQPFFIIIGAGRITSYSDVKDFKRFKAYIINIA